MIAALGCLAAALSISVVWPQVWRSCRHRRTLGLSPTTAWLGVALNLCWLSFGLLVGDPAQVVSNAVVGAGNTAVLIAVLLTQPELRRRRTLLRTAGGAAGLGGVAIASLLSALVLGGSPVAVAAILGGVTSVAGAAAALPQPVRLLRDRAQDMSGLSAARWRLGAGACTTWASYGWLTSETAVWLSAGFGLACSLLMCALLHASRRTRSAGAHTPVHPAPVALAVTRGPARPVLVAA